MDFELRLMDLTRHIGPTVINGTENITFGGEYW
jgi:hypothetical protein